MNIILKAAKVIDPKSQFHNQIVDIHIEQGVITQIETTIPSSNSTPYHFENLHVSRGWMDSSVSLGEPGYEERETISNGLMVAAKSGFTNIALQPNTQPITDSQSFVSFIKHKANGFATEIFPIGALTKKSEGLDLAELYDMHNAGAIAFGDYNKSLKNPNVLKIGLQYVQDFDGLVIAYSENKDIKGNGVAHEGLLSTRLGLKGIPSLAEEIEIARNLYLLEYTGGRLHIPTISTAQSVELIRQAKQKNLNVSCSVAVHQLTLNDEVLSNFDTRFKVTPPLRDDLHRNALIEGIKDGTIDCITSDHNPLDIEHKKLEFDNATSGTIGLESAFGALLTVLPLEIIIEKLTAAKQIFKVKDPSIKVGAKANLTLFNPEGSYTFTKECILSKSKNSAFLNRELKGNVFGIYNQSQLILK